MNKLALALLIFSPFQLTTTNIDSVKFTKTDSLLKGQIYNRNVLPSYYDEYKRTKCPKDPIVIGIFGQSNSSNSVKGFTSINNIPNNLYQYDYISGNCFKYKEPLLPGGGQGNAISHMAVKLSSRTKKPIVITSFGESGSSVTEWSKKQLAVRQIKVIEQLKKQNWDPKVFFWHQGERDSRIELLSKYPFSKIADYIDLIPLKDKYKIKIGIGLNKKIYLNHLSTVIERLTTNFPSAKIGIALVSKCHFNSILRNRSEWNEIRSAQRELSLVHQNIFISADSDKIYKEGDRYLCHFTDEGAKKLSNEYYKTSIKYLLH